MTIAPDFINSGETHALHHVHLALVPGTEVVIFDVGANQGFWTLAAREVFGKPAIVHAFEPVKKNFERLKINTENDARIYLYNNAIGAYCNSAEIYYPKDFEGLSSLYKRATTTMQDHIFDQVEVVGVDTIDCICKNKCIERINFLKLDIEGNEYLALLGAYDMIKNGSIDFIQFEFGGCNIDSKTYFRDFWMLLKNQYKFYEIKQSGLIPVNEYSESMEVFNLTNFLCEKK